MTQWLEAAGCLIIEEDFGTSRVDGLSQWVAGHPLIYINREVPTDRKRLTLAHELGHLVLHAEEVVPDMEGQANSFAAEFLMPLEVIRPQLRNLRVDKLLALKREWGVSMAALIERAYRVDLLKAQERTSLYKMLSARGWRTQEPVSAELPPEHPRLTLDIPLALADKGFTAAEIATLAGFADPQENHLFPLHTQHLRAV